MRRRHRQIEIFSISALDLFASALGAFILVTIILFPYYNQGQAAADQIATMKQDLARETAKTASLNDLQAKLDSATAKLQGLEQQQAQVTTEGRFLLVEVRWPTVGADIDLHVTDPSGREFYWYKSNRDGRDYKGSDAELSFDMTDGPALEVWQDPTAQPGSYEIDYVANALENGATAEVTGTVFDRSGRHPLPPKTLRRAKERVRAATVTVGSDGKIAIR